MRRDSLLSNLHLLPDKPNKSTHADLVVKMLLAIVQSSLPDLLQVMAPSPHLHQLEDPSDCHLLVLPAVDQLLVLLE